MRAPALKAIIPCLDTRRRWEPEIYSGSGGVYAIAADGKGWSIHRVLVDQRTTRPTGPAHPSLMTAERLAKEYARDHNPRT